MPWLMKSEPDVYSIDDLRRENKTWWEGVRNYQARNFMMKDMKVGDEVLFYHSNAEPPAAVGVARVCELAAPDATQFDKKSEYFEPRASREKPMWFCVCVEFVKTFKRPVPLEAIRAEKRLAKMTLVQKGSRLSVHPVTQDEFDLIHQMGNG